MGREGSKQAPIIVASLVIIAVAILAFKLRTHHRAPPLAQTATEPTPVFQGPPIPGFVVLAEQQAAAASQPASPHAGEVPICSETVKHVDPDEPASIESFEMLARTNLTRWLQALQTSGDQRAAAAGLALEWTTDELHERPKARDALVQRALGSSDPAVYAMAVMVCRAEKSRSCDSLKVKEWAQLDADNGVPWLELADAARRRGDQGAEAANFSKLAGASRFDQYSEQFLAISEAHFPSDLSPAEREQMNLYAAGVAVLMPGSNQELFQYCRRVVATSEGHAQCAAVADLLATKGATLLELGIAQDLGRLVDWPAAKLAALGRHSDALSSMLSAQQVLTPFESYNCKNAAEINAFMHERAGKGEVAALEERLQQSGIGEDEAAAQYRSFLAKLKAAVPKNADEE